MAIHTLLSTCECVDVMVHGVAMNHHVVGVLNNVKNDQMIENEDDDDDDDDEDDEK